MTVTTDHVDATINRLLVHHFEFRSVRADQLNIDRAYQRRRDDRHASQIARNFDPMAFGVFLVSERADGKLYIIDGQHRWVALEMLGSLDEMIPCHIYRGLTREDEAFIFQMSTNRKAITPIDRFRSKLFYCDPQSVRINEILRKYGYQISYNNNAVKAVAAIEKVYRFQGPDRIDEIFGLIHAATEDDPDQSPHQTLIVGLNAFLNRYEDQYDRSRLIRVIRNAGGDRIARQAVALRDLINEQAAYAAGRVILKEYNTNMRVNRLPDWDAADPRATGGRIRRTPVVTGGEG